jgi:steroid Delta-isomerase
MTSPAAQRLIAYFEGITPERVAELRTLYTDNARFKDPFNEVRGIQAIEGIFAHMFVSLHEPRFVVTQAVEQGEHRFKRFDTSTPQTVRGASHLIFNTEGKVTLHRDYWDAAEELYEKLPVVGGLMRWLKRRANQ